MNPIPEWILWCIGGGIALFTLFVLIKIIPIYMEESKMVREVKDEYDIPRAICESHRKLIKAMKHNRSTKG